jgi:myo-inositol 2-dehydrogenase / D-chiro-inositol 1-dehydrogenase
MHSTYETFEMEKISFTNGLEARTTTYDFSLATMHEKWGYIEEDRLFVNALDGQSAAPVTADDGYNVVELIEACYRSAREGARVRLGRLVGKL